ncbi:MAG: hypothetical protein Athens071426_342 [Parcubacteria group bacterium Athens0714_26]|nr:MAG: hypothetical protein Athens101426_396 [Parcubacteria group bacterium Athens1014_26]TSD02952.1 MAG: hypothetical protein Athens071426_342 [Parcubacteria group bacterium Athens0714_26]
MLLNQDRLSTIFWGFGFLTLVLSVILFVLRKKLKFEKGYIIFIYLSLFFFLLSVIIPPTP